MKTTEIKKNLKNASIEIRSEEQNYGYLSTWLIVRYQNTYGPTTLMRMDAQSNSLLSNNNLTSRTKPRSTHPRLWFPGFSGSYAASCKSEIRFKYGSNDYDSPERCLNFMKVIHTIIKKYNIDHVYQECELSQIVDAMEKLGARITETYINGTDDTLGWKREQHKKIEQWNETHTELKICL